MEACSDSRKAGGVVRRRLFVKHERDSSGSSHVSVTSQEKRSSGVFSFFRWFKKSDEHISAGARGGETKNSSLPASPNLKRNQSLSCGSLLSTATVSSFSFVNPGKYRQVSLRQIHPGPDTDTYRNRIKQRDHLRELDKDLTLKKKYKLLGGSTTSIYHSVENLVTCARPGHVARSASLGRKKRKAPPPPHELYGHRRTVSDWEAREGRRVHVKGKRKAPPPPTPTSSMNNTLSKSWRKKRPAPSLPFNMEEKHRLLHSLEKLRAHAEQQSSLSNSPLLGGRTSLGNDFLKLESGVLKVNKEDSAAATPVYVPASSSVKDRSVTPNSPVSPRPWYKRTRQPSYSEKFKVKEKDDWLSEGNIQPRKSSISESDRMLTPTQQSHVSSDKTSANHAKSSDSSKPGTSSASINTSQILKRGDPNVTKGSASDPLKTNSSITSVTASDGQKQSASNEKAISIIKPSSSDNQKRSHSFFSDGIKHSLSGSSCNSNPSSRNSNHSSRFSFFSKSSDDSKRRSQVSLLANISALDREAGEIIEREHQRQKALQELENAKYYTDDVVLDHEYSEIVERAINSENDKLNSEVMRNGDKNYSDTSCSGAVNEEVPESKRASTRELISLFNAIGNVTRVTVNTAFFSRDTAAHLFSRSDKKFSVNCKPSPGENRREVFKKIKDFDELEELSESPRAARRTQSEQRSKLRLGFGEPFKLPQETLDNSDDEGVTIEELEDERVERPSTSKSESSRGAHKFHRSPSPSIPTILELSEHSSATTPASTLNPASAFSSLASSPLSPHTPSAPSFSNPRQVPHIAQLVWSCPQCTLENLKWKFVCDACNFFRPFSIEMRPKTNLAIDEPTSYAAKNAVQNGNLEETSILGNIEKTEGSTTDPSNSDKKSNLANGESGFCSRPSISQLPRKAPYYMSDVLKSPVKQDTSLAEKMKALPSTSIMDTQPCQKTAETKINKALKENESNEVKENREVEELRKARLAFFDKTNRGTETKIEPQAIQSSQTSAINSVTANGEPTSTKLCDKADLKKIKELLREMKHSMPQSSNNSLINGATSRNDHEIKPFVKFENSRAIQKLKTSQATTSTTSSSVTQPNQTTRTSVDVMESTREKASSSKVSNLLMQTNSKTESSEKTLNANSIVNRCVTNNTGVNPPIINGTNLNQPQINGTNANKPIVNGTNSDAPKINGTDVSKTKNTNVTRVSKLNGTSRQEHEGAIKRTNNSSLVVNDIDFDDNSLDRVRMEDDKKAELYLIKSKTILEDILVKRPTSKVSISVQTNSSIVRKTEIQSTNPDRDAYNVSVPVVHEHYRINPDGSLVTSLSKKNKIIGTGTFQLIRSHDFVGIEAAKAGRSLLPNGIPNHTYANVDDESISTSTCTSSTNCTSQVSPLGQQDETSNLIRSKCFADFKARFVSSNSNVNTVAVNRLLKRLEAAIAAGEHHKAASLAKELARLKISCSVTRQQPADESCAPSSQPSRHILINMYVEDKVSHQGPIPLSVLSTMTVAQLKRKLEIEYDIPCQVQRWILGKSLGTNENATLEEMGVKENGTPVFLYLVAPESPGMISNASSSAGGPILGIPGPHSLGSPILGVPGPCATPMSPEAHTASTSFGTLNSAESSRASSLERDMSELNPQDDYIVEEFEEEIQTNTATSDLPSTSNFSPHARNFSPLFLTKFTPLSPSKDSPPAPSNPSPASSNMSPPLVSTVNKAPLSSNSVPASSSPQLYPNSSASTSSKTSPVDPTSTNALYLTPPSDSSAPSTSTNKPTASSPLPSLSSTPSTSTNRNTQISPPTKESPASPDAVTFPSSSPLTGGHGTLQIGWSCPLCTLMNSPARPGCAACQSQRPKDYRVPEHYEDRWLLREQTIEKEVQAQKVANYEELVLLERADLVITTQTFECPICLTECRPPHGAVLRECLHSFCKQCLSHTIQYNSEVQVKCPYRDATYSCDSPLQEREIKALVSPAQFEAHLAKSLAQAETQIRNAFHCKTPDCRGWCIFEDNVNEFRCPVCTHLNCLTCQAIHDGLDCRQYQDHMKADSDTNADARRTRDMLDEMVDRGEAMVCPQCHVVLMKKWGCDWLRCSMCKTEICWVTRGPRWGPNGKGDTTAGCKCGVNGVKCHPRCNYCH